MHGEIFARMTGCATTDATRRSVSRAAGPTRPPAADGRHSDTVAGLFATPILIIEDEAILAWMIEELLEQAGFHAIEVAASGDQALQAARRRMPGIIISDVNLGAGIDGIEASRAICEESDIPVIFVTGFAADTMAARLEREMPRASLLRKPLDGAVLMRAVMRLLAN